MSALPRWTERHGWRGGDSHTLYAFTYPATGRIIVVPGHAHDLATVHSCTTVRIATRAEAEAGWQSPLHAGWTVA